MEIKKQISTGVGIAIIVATAVVLFGGVFAYQYFENQKSSAQQNLVQSSAKAGSQSCRDVAVTQYDINICAGNLEKAADAKLNTLYQKITTQLDGKSLNQLSSTEKAWITYRDENCHVPSIFPEAGSGAVADQALCMEQLTNDRIKELNNLYQGYITGIQGISTSNSSQTADWKTYTNSDYGFEFKYPNGITVVTQNKNTVTITDTRYGYTFSWGMNLYNNTGFQDLQHWIQSQCNGFKNVSDKDCKIFASGESYNDGRADIGNVKAILVDDTSDFNQSCADMGYYIMSPDKLTVIKFNDIVQASPDLSKDIFSTFTFTK